MYGGARNPGDDMAERITDEWIERNVPGGLNSQLGQQLDNMMGGNPNPTPGQQLGSGGPRFGGVNNNMGGGFPGQPGGGSPRPPGSGFPGQPGGGFPRPPGSGFPVRPGGNFPGQAGTEYHYHHHHHHHHDDHDHHHHDHHHH